MHQCQHVSVHNKVYAENDTER